MANKLNLVFDFNNIAMRALFTCSYGAGEGSVSALRLLFSLLPFTGCCRPLKADGKKSATVKFQRIPIQNPMSDRAFIFDIIEKRKS